MSKDEFLSGFTKSDKLIPVITLVVYFGTTPWDGAMNLKDMFGELDKDISKFIPSYNLNLISPHLSDEDLEKLKSELGAVMQFIKNSNDKKKLLDKLEGNKKFQKLSPMSAMVISEITGIKMNINHKKEKIDMCKAINDLIEDAKKEAEKETKKAKEKLEIANEKVKSAYEKVKSANNVIKAEKEKVKSANEKVKSANNVIKAEKEKNKVAKLRIKEL